MRLHFAKREETLHAAGERLLQLGRSKMSEPLVAPATQSMALASVPRFQHSAWVVRLEARAVGGVTVMVYSIVGPFRIGDAGTQMARARNQGVRHELWDLGEATFDGWEYHSSAERLNQLRPLFTNGLRIAAIARTREQFTTARMLKTVAETEGLNAQIEVFTDESSALRWLTTAQPPGIPVTLPPKVER